MPLGVSLWFEPNFEATLRDLWSMLEREGVESPLFDGRYRPHVTLGIWTPLRRVEREAALRAVLALEPPLTIRFEAVGMFPGESAAVFLQPVVTARLLALQAGVHLAMEALGDASWPHYVPGRWMPHCTMAAAIDASSMLRAAALLRDQAGSLEGRAVAIGMVDTPGRVMAADTGSPPTEIELCRLALGHDRSISPTDAI